MTAEDFFREFKGKDTRSMGKNVHLEKFFEFFFLAWNIQKWSLQREDGDEIANTLVLKSMFPLTSQKCYLIPRITLSFSVSVLFFFGIVLLLLRSSFLFLIITIGFKNCSSFFWNCLFYLTCTSFSKNPFFQLIVPSNRPIHLEM